MSIWCKLGFHNWIYYFEESKEHCRDGFKRRRCLCCGLWQEWHSYAENGWLIEGWFKIEPPQEN